jgi:cobalamin-dependent methionine synthase I
MQMKIIGEKINGTRRDVANAIEARDEDYIKDLAKKQAEAGVTWLDVNAGTHPDREADDLMWLIENIQAVVDTPLSLDSANPKAIMRAIKAAKKTPLINSISGEPERLRNVLSIAAEHGCDVIALAMNDKKIPETVAERMTIIDMILSSTRARGIPDDKVYIDPLAMAIATMNQSAVIAFGTIRAVREKYPQAHLTIGLSNISYGMPGRKHVNSNFLMMAMQAGIDSAILDPLDNDLRAAIITSEMLLGNDKHCRNYLKAFRAGLIL